MNHQSPATPTRRRRTTLTDVAHAARVSYQTVSNVINAPERVRPETAAKVRRAIDELGFTPHATARQLRSGQSFNIGVRLVPVHEGISGAVLDEFLHALTESAQEAGYRVMLFTAADDSAEIARYRELHDQGQVDGFVLTATHPNDPRTRYLLDHEIPFVTFGRPWEPDGHEHWVDVDGSTGIREAMDALARAGHERIGFVGWPAGSGVGDERQAAWAAATGDQSLIERREDIIAEGADALHALAARGATAVVCVSDTLALGAFTAARTLSHGGTRPPAIVGFDDSVVARSLGFSSIAQPLGDVARRCLTTLLATLRPGTKTAAATAPKTTPATAPSLLPSRFIERPTPETPEAPETPEVIQGETP
ncbi:LacI family DNA-binding transcriptional regulator [Micrococcales bacterium 31B]|nr:LacI family DNA-binding transcriptional regulator [Micrococcales bacterium 31B]